MTYLISRLEVICGRVQSVEISNCALNDDDVVADLNEEACPTRDKQQRMCSQLSHLDPNAVMHV